MGVGIIRGFSNISPLLHPWQMLSVAWRRFPDRFRLALLIYVVALVSFQATRLILAACFPVGGPWWGYPASFLMGLIFDFAAASFFVAPVWVTLALLPNRVAAWRITRLLGLAWFAATIFVLLFLIVAEWVFWEEFGGRFNFIAVDYLIYTQEVIGNIWQSYPAGKILLGVAVLALSMAILIGRKVWSELAMPLGLRARFVGLALALAVPLVAVLWLDSGLKNRFDSEGQNELAGNGPWEFFAALHNNELDYLRHYRTLPEARAEASVRHMLKSERGQWRSREGLDLMRHVNAQGALTRPNVVLISVESLGAEFLGSWGDSRGLTPNLDALAQDSLVLGNVFATGNRTVRGLEALSLSIPPTPGQSIVKRPGNQHLATLGAVFEDAGYVSLFLYGGYGYFDNMNAYFSANDYQVFDRTAIRPEAIHHENIWGVADEDLFDSAIEHFDSLHAASKPFFAHLMTTSNHRPYTYPAGRIDIPSGSGREGAVKYTDWAIGHLIDSARHRPWFDNTLFVITADHGANARGAGAIPVDSYRIPAIFYAPRWIAPRRHDRLASQIDILPTLLGLVGLPYDSKYLGFDLLRSSPSADRAFVANYQTLGYLRDGRMVTLKPKRKVEVSASALVPRLPNGSSLSDEALIEEAIAWYQTASMFYRNGFERDEDHPAEH